MTKKLSYAQLEQRVKKLEKEALQQKQAQEVLRHSEDKYRTLLEHLPQKIFHKDMNSVYVSCNRNYARDLKIKPEEIKGKTDYAFFPKKLARKYRADDKRIMASGKREDIEEEYLRDGREIWVKTVKTPIKDKRGPVRGVLGIFWDITQEKRAAEALRESEEKYRLLVESSDAGITFFDKAGTYLFLNRTAAKWLGGKPDDYVGKTVHDTFPKGLADRFVKRFRRIIRSGVGETIEEIVEPLDRWISSNLQPVRNQDGKAIGVQVLTYDITERKQAEEALRNSEKRFRSFLENLGDVAYETDSKGIITYANKMAEKITGMPLEDFLGKPFLALFTEESQKVAVDVFKRTLNGETPEYELTFTNGKIGHFKNEPLRDKERKIIGVFGIARDITERKQVEQTLKQRETTLEIRTNELEEANSALRVLLKRVDEDKRQVEEKVSLNVKELVLPFAEKLKKSGLDAEQMAYLNILESNLDNIVSPFVYRLSWTYLGLTPTEIRVASLVRDGKTTKEIAELLNSSERTVEQHRQRIRMKVGIKNKKANLRSLLLAT